MISKFQPVALDQWARLSLWMLSRASKQAAISVENRMWCFWLAGRQRIQLLCHQLMKCSIGLKCWSECWLVSKVVMRPHWLACGQVSVRACVYVVANTTSRRVLCGRFFWCRAKNWFAGGIIRLYRKWAAHILIHSVIVQVIYPTAVVKSKSK